MSRKSAGESSIYKGADGRWHGLVSMGLKQGGERDRRHVAALKRVDVVGKVRALEQQRKDGVVLVGGRMPTVQQWTEMWLETIASRRIRPRTSDGYRTCLVKIHRELGHHRLDRLQPEHVEAFYRQLRDDGLAPATVLLHHRVLSRALKVAVQRGRIARNVATLVDAPR